MGSQNVIAREFEKLKKEVGSDFIERCVQNAPLEKGDLAKMRKLILFLALNFDSSESEKYTNDETRL